MRDKRLVAVVAGTGDEEHEKSVKVTMFIYPKKINSTVYNLM